VHLGADHQHMVVEPALDVRLRHGEAVDEAGALVAHVEGANGPRPELLLDQDPVPGKDVIRREGGEDDQVDVVHRDPGVRDRLARGFGAEVGRSRPRVDVPALPDPVRCTIHSSDVSIHRVSSSFFTTRGGRAAPCR